MRSMIQRIQAETWVAKALQWGKLVTVTGATQALVQAVGFASGIIIIRLLPTEQYALYVLANTMIGTMAVLTDAGLSTGVTARGGLVWNNKERLGAVLVTAFNLRKKFALIALAVAVPVTVYLLLNHGAGTITTILIVASIIPTLQTVVSGSLYQVALKLRQDLVPLQRNQVIMNCMRLVGSTLALFLFPFAFVAVLANGAAQLWANLDLKKTSQKYSDWSQRPDPEIRQELMKFVKRLLPGSIYFCVSSQVSIWLISLFGSTSSIAHVGALTRLAMILTLFTTLFNVLIVPRFARASGNRKELRDRYIRIQLLLVMMSIGIVGMSWIFSKQILWTLGPNYLHLRQELVLCMIGNCLNVMVGINYILNSSRGWLLHPVISIGLGLIGIIAGVSLIDIGTLRGVLLFNVFTGIVGLFVHPLYGLLKIRNLKPELAPS